MRAYELHGVNDSDIPADFRKTEIYHFPTIPGHEFSGVVAAYGEGSGRASWKTGFR